VKNQEGKWSLHESRFFYILPASTNNQNTAQLISGEWFLDTEFGTPYLQQILGKQLTLSGALAALRKSILEVDGVNQILEFNYNFSNHTRLLTVNFTVKTRYGQIEVSA
jgi:hypothetical protein